MWPYHLTNTATSPLRPPWQVDRAKLNAKHLAAPENRRTKLEPAAIAALRLLLFTGAGLREILHIRWQEVDLERGLAFLPDSKTGRKTLVLSDAALEVLRNVPKNQHLCYQRGQEGSASCGPQEAMGRHSASGGFRGHQAP